MEQNIVTIDTIQDWLTSQIEKKLPIDGHTFMDAASKINVLLQGEQEKLYRMEQAVAYMRREILEEGKTASHAKIVVESSNQYREARTQKAKIERALELIRLVKAQARMSTELMRNQL